MYPLAVALDLRISILGLNRAYEVFYVPRRAGPGCCVGYCVLAYRIFNRSSEVVRLKLELDRKTSLLSLLETRPPTTL
jgi:hypothetical protein